MYIINSSKQLALSSSTDQHVISTSARKSRGLRSLQSTADMERPESSQRRDHEGVLLTLSGASKLLPLALISWYGWRKLAESVAAYWMLGITQSHFYTHGILVSGPQMDTRIIDSQAPCAKWHTANPLHTTYPML